jgi:Tfp pilus assembly protein PilP
MTSPARCRTTLLVCGLVGMFVGAWAQAPSPAASPVALPAGSPAVAVPAADEGLRELAPPPGAYRYNAGGRRDPFMSLVRRGGAAKEDEAKRKQGIEGLLISELALQGIIKTADGYIAFFAGPNGKSYWVKNNQRFYDGQLIGIDATTATFKQEVSDPLNPVKTRDVKKYLYPSEEATQ